MTFLIADTFTDSLARLTGDEQKAITTTAFDLQLDPSAPGLSFHRLDKARDKRFWSVRANADIRLIVHRTDSSLLLCYVDHTTAPTPAQMSSRYRSSCTGNDSSGRDGLGPEMRYPVRLSWRELTKCFQPDYSEEVTYDVVEEDLCEATWPIRRRVRAPRRQVPFQYRQRVNRDDRLLLSVANMKVRRRMVVVVDRNRRKTACRRR